MANFENYEKQVPSRRSSITRLASLIASVVKDTVLRRGPEIYPVTPEADATLEEAYMTGSTLTEDDLIKTMPDELLRTLPKQNR